MTTPLNLLDLAAALTQAQEAINAQANSQPEIDRLKNELDRKLDYITTLEANVLGLKADIEQERSSFNRLSDEVSTLRKERDDHALEAMDIRDELDTLKANIDRALGAATETFYSTMQMKPQATVDHIHAPIEDVQKLPEPPAEPTSFSEPEPSYGNVMAWNSWNKARVDWNNKITNGPDADWSKVVHSTNTNQNYSY